MKKIDRHGMECELAGASQYIHMLRKELKKRTKPDYVKLIDYAKHIESSGNFCYFILDGLKRNSKKSKLRVVTLDYD